MYQVHPAQNIAGTVIFAEIEFMLFISGYLSEQFALKLSLKLIYAIVIRG